MQIQAYQQHLPSLTQNDLVDDNHNLDQRAAQSTTKRPADPHHIDVQPSQKGSQPTSLSQTVEHLRHDDQVQAYVKRMMMAIDSGNLNTQQFAHQAPAAMQQLASRLGISLPQQIETFKDQLTHRPQGKTHPSLRFVNAESSQPHLFKQLAGINTNA